MEEKEIGHHQRQQQQQQFVFLEQLLTKLATYPCITFEQKRRASVAVILRIKPKADDEGVVQYHQSSNHEQATNGNNCPTDRILSLLNDKHVRSGTVEMLYIKRALNPRDRWSGHVAFPGGHVDDGELPKAAAERETLEEIGLNLADGKNFAFLGRLDDRAATDTLTVSSFVYLQVSSRTPPLELNLKEVAGVLWVPVNVFLENTNAMLLRPHVVQLHIGPKFLRESRLLDFLGLSAVHFPSLLLPNLPECSLEYILWGLTLGITSEIYVLGANRIPLHKPLFRFNNRLANGIMQVTYMINSLICPGKEISYRSMIHFVFGGVTLVFVFATALVVKAKV